MGQRQGRGRGNDKEIFWNSLLRRRLRTAIERWVREKAHQGTQMQWGSGCLLYPEHSSWPARLAHGKGGKTFLKKKDAREVVCNYTLRVDMKGYVLASQC